MWPREWWYETLQVERLWKELGTRGEHTTVGVWDTGMDNRWGLIEGNRLVFKDYLDGGSNEPSDSHPEKHGSLVASIIGSKADECGIAPRCQMRIARATGLKLLGDFRPFLPGEVFEDAQIINISHAFRVDDPDVSPAVTGFTEALAGTDKLIVAAMGNYSRAGRTPLTTVPASLPDVIGVNGTARGGGLYSGSINSAFVDLIAPGNEIASPFSTTKQAGTSLSAAMITGVSCLVHSALVKRGRKPSSSTVARILLSSTSPVPLSQKATHGVGPIDIDALIKNTNDEP